MNIPTKITMARIILIVGMLMALLGLDIAGACGAFITPMVGQGISVVRLVTCVIFIVASTTDFLDGYLARKWHQVTDLGKFLDPIADKLLVDSMLIFLVIPASYEAAGTLIIPVFCTIIMIARDLVVDGLRQVAATKHVVLAANMWGKVKTFSQMVAIPVVLLNGWPFTYFDSGWGYGRIGLILIYIATAASLLSGVVYLFKNWGVLKEAKNG